MAFKSEYLNKVYAEAEKRNPGELTAALEFNLTLQLVHTRAVFVSIHQLMLQL